MASGRRPLWPGADDGGFKDPAGARIRPGQGSGRGEVTSSGVPTLCCESQDDRSALIASFDGKTTGSKFL